MYKLAKVIVRIKTNIFLKFCLIQDVIRCSIAVLSGEELITKNHVIFER